MHKILVVDDSMMIRVNLKKLLERNGYTVVSEASNGQEAVDKYKEHRPDLITMDITMPLMDGLEALKQIKRLDREAKVVMISALGQELKIAEALDYGALHYMIKPFKDHDILNVIQSVLA